MMDPTFNYVAPADQGIAAASNFGDDEDFTTYDQSVLLGTTLPDESLSFITETLPFSTPVDFPAVPLETLPLYCFEGYLEGNFDFDESLLNNGVDLSWGADMYNQAFAEGMDNLHIPSLSSTASESQTLSPETLLLPYTPPEANSLFSSTIPSPSNSNNSNVSPSSSNQTTIPRKSSSSTGPKRQLRKIIKPEACPVCGKGHAQLRERDRHIITQHYDEAVRMGLNVARAECSICDQTFRRKDHLTRHMKRRHGW